MLHAIEQSIRGENPEVLIERTLTINEEKTRVMHISLLVATNKPLPYYLIQIYDKAEPEDKYHLNFALSPSAHYLELIRDGLLSSLDCIVGGLKKSLEEGIPTYNRPELGQAYTNFMFDTLDIFERLIGQAFDERLKTWFSDTQEKP